MRVIKSADPVLWIRFGTLNSFCELQTVTWNGFTQHLELPDSTEEHLNPHAYFWFDASSFPHPNTSSHTLGMSKSI